MVYEWDPHKDVLYRMYIEERKHLDSEIIPFMRDNHNFNPSKRAYQTQFKRWEFPSKQNPAHRNLELVDRVKELWEQNTSQGDMVSILIEEGYNIKERELMRLRAKYRWLLRVPNGKKVTSKEDFGEELLASTNQSEQTQIDSTTISTPIPLVPTLAPEEAARKRKERQEELQMQSDERWAAKKRRRRTRGYAGMAADPPGPPRFPSETTLEESKQFLSLDDKHYRHVRDLFDSICKEESIVKKTLAGPEKWQAAKDRLIQEDPHLQSVFWVDTINLETKALALDVVCLDVTKRIRVGDRSMTIANAKNVLGVNPEQGRQIRNAFYAILKVNRFTSKTEAGKELWQKMKQQWIDGSPFLQSAMSPDDPEHATKAKAMDTLCRDVMKRLRDDVARKPEDAADSSVMTNTSPAQSTTSFNPPTAIRGTRTTTTHASTSAATNTTSDLQIDPTLLQAVDDFTYPAASPVAVYVRPHPQSDLHGSTKMWLGALSSSPTVAGLKNLLTSKYSDVQIARVDGIEKGVDGKEISYLIEEDEELDAYLDHVQGRKAVFVALLKKF